LTELL